MLLKRGLRWLNEALQYQKQNISSVIFLPLDRKFFCENISATKQDPGNIVPEIF